MKEIKINIKKMAQLQKKLELLSLSMEYNSVKLLGFTLSRSDVDITLMVIEMTLNGLNPYNEMPLAETSLSLLEKAGAIKQVEYDYNTCW